MISPRDALEEHELNRIVGLHWLMAEKSVLEISARSPFRNVLAGAPVSTMYDKVADGETGVAVSRRIC